MRSIWSTAFFFFNELINNGVDSLEGVAGLVGE